MRRQLEAQMRRDRVHEVRINESCPECGGNNIVVLTRCTMNGRFCDGDKVICKECGNGGYIIQDPDEGTYCVVWFSLT